MMKKQKKKSLAKTIVQGIVKMAVVMVGALLIITMFALAYLQVDGHDKIWIITEWDRSATTILFPEEY